MHQTCSASTLPALRLCCVTPVTVPTALLTGAIAPAWRFWGAPPTLLTTASHGPWQVHNRSDTGGRFPGHRETTRPAYLWPRAKDRHSAGPEAPQQLTQSPRRGPPTAPPRPGPLLMHLLLLKGPPPQTPDPVEGPCVQAPVQRQLSEEAFPHRQGRMGSLPPDSRTFFCPEQPLAPSLHRPQPFQVLITLRHLLNGCHCCVRPRPGPPRGQRLAEGSS